MKTILLHICCAPCAIFPLEILGSKGFLVKGLFFNPNIHPLTEYMNRLSTVQGYVKDAGLELEIDLYDPKIFFHAIHRKEDSPSRCHICWRLRLNQTAKIAKEGNFDFFTTTLLGSPYQDTLMLEEIGEGEARNFNIKFLKEDFKSGFRRAHNQAKKDGMYCQKYCGCIYSEIERYHKNDK